MRFFELFGVGGLSKNNRLFRGPDFYSASVTFEPGVRTNWHYHHNGQQKPGNLKSDFKFLGFYYAFLFFIFPYCCTNEFCCVRQLFVCVRCHEGDTQACCALGYRRVADGRGEYTASQQLVGNL